MMAAAQPFLSGAISKTVNMPREATVEDIRDAYLEGWKLGLKALAIYRDGSKESQPVSTSSEDPSGDKSKATADSRRTSSPPAGRARPPELDSARPGRPAPAAPASAPARGRPSPAASGCRDTRRSMTHKFDIQGHEGYINVGFYDDGRPGELFITMAKEGSTVGGLMDVSARWCRWACNTACRSRSSSTSSPTAGSSRPGSPRTRTSRSPRASPTTSSAGSGIQFVPGYREANAPNATASSRADAPGAVPRRPPSAPVIKVNGHRTATIADLERRRGRRPALARRAPPVAPVAAETSAERPGRQFAHFQSDAPACDNCGALTVRCGTCYRCFNCGNSMGCS